MNYRKELNKNLKEFKNICSNIQYSKQVSLIKALKINHDLKLDVQNPTLRGIYLEEALLLKIIHYNKSKAIYRTEGRFSTKLNCFRMRCAVNPTLHKQNLKRFPPGLCRNDYLIVNGLDCGKEKQGYHEIPFLKNKIFKAKFRCFAKVSIDYCFIDILIDKTLIDIKTDLNTKKIKTYFRQALMQSVMFSSFVKRNKVFQPIFTPSEIQSFGIPIDSIALYFWRSNEYFKFYLKDILEPGQYLRLVEIYSDLYSCGTVLRNIIKKSSTGLR